LKKNWGAAFLSRKIRNASAHWAQRYWPRKSAGVADAAEIGEILNDPEEKIWIV
jgi:hypothetical protein